MVSVEKKYGLRQYKANEIVWFRKTSEAFGGLSNMCSGYPLVVNGYHIRSSEALYQACRFPDSPDLQSLIINEKSPMTAKMKSKPHRISTRDDWESVRVAVMRWTLQVKLAQNFIKFGKLLEESCPKQIVEDSRKDIFWGAVREKSDNSILTGVNALGRLLMELRQKYMSENRYELLLVEPLEIKNFKIFGEPIQAIDERVNFVGKLLKVWGIDTQFSITHRNRLVKHNEHETNKQLENPIQHVVNESLFDLATVKPNKYVIDEEKNEELKNKILLLLKNGNQFSSKELIKRLRVDWTTKRMTSYLKHIDEVQVLKESPLKFKIKQQTYESTLF